MARFVGSTFSKTMDMDTGLCVVTPRRNLDRDEPYSVVYLLHGLSDNHESWCYNTQLSLLADQYRTFFIMPEVARSFYVDMKYGPQYFTYVADELPQQCRRLFHITAARERTGVFGLSMGGYGALQLALRCPETFGLCGAFSSCTDVMQLIDAAGPGNPEAQAIFGAQYEDAPAQDLCGMIAAAASNPAKVQYYAAVGTEDFTLQMNRSFRDQMQAAGMAYQYEEFAGDHDWYFWNKALHRAMAQLFGAPT